MNTVAYKSWDEVKANLDAKSKLRDALGALVKKRQKSKSKDNERLFPCLKYAYGELVVDQGRFRPPRLLVDEKATGVLYSHLGLKRTESDNSNSPRIPLGFVAKDDSDKPHGILEASFSITRNIGTGSLWEKRGYPEIEVLPQALLRPGSPFGLFEFFDFHRKLGNPPAYDVSAGCRSPFVVANFGATGLLGKLRAQFQGCDETALKQFKISKLPLSELIQKILPAACAEYTTEIILIPFWLLGDAKDADAREFLRIALEEAWDQSAHLRNGFIEMLNSKDFIGKWLDNSEIPSDYFEPMARFISGVEWVIKNQIPGYTINRDGNCGVLDSQECSGGPFPELVKGLDAIFANRKPHLRCLLFFPEYFRDCKKESMIYVPSRLNRPGRKWGKRKDFVTKVTEAFNLAKTNAKGETTLLSQTELLFDARAGKKLTLRDFGIEPAMPVTSKFDTEIIRNCSPHLHHWFFNDGFARIQKY
jgi:hypothetical protein